MDTGDVSLSPHRKDAPFCFPFLDNHSNLTHMGDTLPVQRWEYFCCCGHFWFPYFWWLIEASSEEHQDLSAAKKIWCELSLTFAGSNICSLSPGMGHDLICPSLESWQACVTWIWWCCILTSSNFFVCWSARGGWNIAFIGFTVVIQTIPRNQVFGGIPEKT